MKSEPDDGPYFQSMALIERAGDDERNFVKKAVNWALRRIGTRNPALHAAAVATAQKLTASSQRAARWIGRTALADLTGATGMRRLAAQQARA